MHFSVAQETMRRKESQSSWVVPLSRFQLVRLTFRNKFFKPSRILQTLSKTPKCHLLAHSDGFLEPLQQSSQLASLCLILCARY
jgi:hypothetical protein